MATSLRTRDKQSSATRQSGEPNINPVMAKIVTGSNGLMVLLLRSPLHRLLSKSLMLISFTGRTSGKRFTTPVGYKQDGDIVTFFSFAASRWWKNLAGGALVSVRLRGREMKGHAEAIKDNAAVSEGITALAREDPRMASFFKVKADAAGRLDPDEVKRAAERLVMVRVKVDV